MPGNLGVSINTMALMNCTPVPCCSNLEVKKAAIKFSKKEQETRKKMRLWAASILNYRIVISYKSKRTKQNVQKKGKWHGTGMLMKRLNRLQLWDSHLTHKTLQGNNKVGVWGKKIEMKEPLFTLLGWSAQEKTCIKAILSENTGLHKKTLPNLEDLFYSKLCHCSEIMQCLPERKLIVNCILQKRLYIIIQFGICYVVSLENNFHLVQHKMS